MELKLQWKCLLKWWSKHACRPAHPLPSSSTCQPFVDTSAEFCAWNSNWACWAWNLETTVLHVRVSVEPVELAVELAWNLKSKGLNSFLQNFTHSSRQTSRASWKNFALNSAKRFSTDSPQSISSTFHERLLPSHHRQRWKWKLTIDAATRAYEL